MKIKNKKGVSLIVVIITIIVMIILAATIILSLQSSGIIGRANEAKSKTDISNAKQVVSMAQAEWQLDEEKIKSEDPEIASFKEYAEAKLEEAGYKVGTGKNSYIVTLEGKVIGSGTENMMYIDSDGRHVIIPEGFVASKIATEDTVTEGLVIYEGTADVTETDSDSNGIIDAQEKRNQFVWIPVDNIGEFKRVNWKNTEDFLDLYTEPCSKLDTLSAKNDETGEYAEYNAIKESVSKYGGFYIGRYESATSVERTDSANETTDVLVRKNKSVYNYVGCGQSMTEITGNVIYGKNQGKGAMQLSRELYSNSSSVVSTLCYGVEWDAALNFISKSDSAYALESTNKGNYTNTLAKTGYHDMRNIYDMAGNVYEWTMEAYSNSFRVVRGGGFISNGTSVPASSRLANTPYIAVDYFGFRIALYIK